MNRALHACARWTLCLGLVALLGADAASQPASDAPAADDTAAHIRALMDGTLDVAVDPASLFAVDLSAAGTNAPALRALLDGVAEPPDPKARRREPRALPPFPPAATGDARALWQARRAFFSLTPQERAEVLARHAERQRAASAAVEREASTRERIALVTTHNEHLRAYLAGTLDLDTDPASVLQVNLLDEHGIARDSHRRRAVLGDAAAAPDQPAASELEGELAAAYAEADRLLAAYLALTPEQRADLRTQHDARVQAREDERLAKASAEAEAEQAAKAAAEQQQQALEAARSAATEGARLLEEERARLHGIRQRQSLYAAQLEAVAPQILERRERVLRWGRRVNDIRSERDRAAADRAYDELVGVLTDARRNLDEALDALAASSSGLPSLRDPAPIELPAHVDSSSLDELRRDVRQADQDLRALEQRVQADSAAALRDEVVALNRDRLRLFPRLSERRRAELAGFGPEGVAQVQRELSQIRLELRYHARALPRIAGRIRADLSARPLNTALTFLELLVVLVLFRQWRRRSTGYLVSVRRTWLGRRPQTKTTLFVAGCAWYAQRVRAPLEWLLLLWLIRSVTPAVVELPELSVLWTVAVWVLVGNFVIRLVDAVAARQPSAGGADETARLRYRSLRLVGVAVIVVGLILSVAGSLVGKGAIYAWVWRSCWVLAVPIVLVLMRWWKPIIFERAAARQNPGAALRWTLRHQSGLSSVPATAVGGAVLLADGLARYALAQASHLAVTRRLLAHLFRREVEKRAAARADDASYDPIGDAAHDQLDPDAASEVLVTSVAEQEVKRISDVVRDDNNALIAVVGERGMGKTRFMRRVIAGLSEDRVRWITVRPGGFDLFVRDLAASLALPPDSDEAAVVAALRANRPDVICIDDAQRLVRPLIGGLVDIDRLVAFAHDVGPTTSWLVAIGGPAWQYLRRARGERAVFDEVAELQPWNEDQIRELVSARSAEAAVDPKFDELVVPRQMNDAQYGEAERTERDYCRILWDYADGNPNVALHFWRESLATRNDATYVRLFKTPPMSTLDSLPSSLHFVLRAILQMELATEADIARCTGLPTADVTDALRVARTRKFVEDVDGYIRVTLPWFRGVNLFLRRQHLLVG